MFSQAPAMFCFIWIVWMAIQIVYLYTHCRSWSWGFYLCALIIRFVSWFLLCFGVYFLPKYFVFLMAGHNFSLLVEFSARIRSHLVELYQKLKWGCLSVMLVKRERLGCSLLTHPWGPMFFYKCGQTIDFQQYLLGMSRREAALTPLLQQTRTSRIFCSCCFWSGPLYLPSFLLWDHMFRCEVEWQRS